MSGDKYLISDKAGCYFVTFTVIHWIDIFSRKEYRDIIVDSLNYCISPPWRRYAAKAKWRWRICANENNCIF